MSDTVQGDESKTHLPESKAWKGYTSRRTGSEGECLSSTHDNILQ